MTPEQKAERRTRLGASEVAAALGLSSYQTPMGLWCEKTGRTEPDGDSFPAKRGRALEPLALDEYAESHLNEGEVLWRNKADSVRTFAEPWIAATVDGVVYQGEVSDDYKALPEPRRIVEAKTAGRWTAHKFGAEGTDELPKEYVIQCAWQMMVWDLPRADVIAIVEDEPRVYTVMRDDGLERKMLAKARSFWQLVLDDTPPELDASAATKAYLETEFPTAGLSVRDADDTEEAVARELMITREILLSAQEEYDRVKHEMASLIADDKGIAGTFGSIHYRGQKKTTTDWKAIAKSLGASDEDIARHTREFTTSRSIYPHFKKEA